jgi:hypothetical protein
VDDEIDIVVGSYKHQDTFRNQWSAKGVLAKRRSWDRPEWAKTYRCVSDSADTCEDCYVPTTKPRWTLSLQDALNCWDHGGFAHGARAGPRIWVDVGQAWQKYSYLIHLRCEAGAASIKFGIFDIGHATLRYLFDGEDVTQDRFNVRFGNIPTELGHAIDLNSPIESFKTWALPKGTSSTWRNIVLMNIPLSEAGPHELLFEFLPNPDRQDAAFANLQEIHIFMPPVYADCEDSKACLKKLTWTNGAQLRNNNTLQRECLTTEPEPHSACQRWRDCLNSSISDQLLALLNAAFPAATATSNESQATVSSHDCMNPATEDPESWMCDCYETMLSRCQEINMLRISIDVCIRAQYCQYDRVCASWKAKSCHDAEVTDMIQQLSLSSNSSSLSAMSTRAAKSPRALDKDAEFDETLHTKHCT